MKHADSLTERILFLEGLPNLQDLGKLCIGENTREILECDLSLEMDAIPDLRDGIEYCEKKRDFVSRDLLCSIIESEEEHVDWLETQLGLIDKMGLENYLAEKMHENGNQVFASFSGNRLRQDDIRRAFGLDR